MSGVLWVVFGNTRYFVPLLLWWRISLVSSNIWYNYDIMTCFFRALSVYTSQRQVTYPSHTITSNHSNRSLTPTPLLNILLIEPVIMQQKQDPQLFPHPPPCPLPALHLPTSTTYPCFHPCSQHRPYLCACPFHLVTRSSYPEWTATAGSQRRAPGGEVGGSGIAMGGACLVLVCQ